MPPRPPLRGQVYWVHLPNVGRKPFVVVSNNQRNSALGDCVIARVTTATKPRLDTVVVLGSEDLPVEGSVVCDDLATIRREHLVGLIGSLSKTTMRRVAHGLRLALSL